VTPNAARSIAPLRGVVAADARPGAEPLPRCATTDVGHHPVVVGTALVACLTIWLGVGAGQPASSHTFTIASLVSKYTCQ